MTEEEMLEKLKQIEEQARMTAQRAAAPAGKGSAKARYRTRAVHADRNNDCAI
jgi:hypothetical protein